MTAGRVVGRVIRYTLKCNNDHEFESWFKSASAFEALERSGHLTCAVCGSPDVSKAIMSPRVATGEAPEAPAPVKANDAERALAALKEHVEQNADYVGTDFAKEARSMYLGATPERAIFGEARQDEAKALIDDGIPVAPLPFVPKRKAN